MKAMLVTVISTLAGALPIAVLKKAADAFLDVIEDEVKASKTKLDDIFVLPLCKIVRATLRIPDND